MSRQIETTLSRWAGRLVLLAIAVAVLLATFFAGVHAQQVRTIPYRFLHAAYKTLAVNLDIWTTLTATVQPKQKASHDLPLCDPRPADFPTPMQAKKMGLPNLLCPLREDAVAARIEFIGGEELADPILVQGEFGAFLDHCPGPAGCLAAEYSRSGAVTRAWPFRPEDISLANIVSESDYPREHPAGWLFASGAYHFGISLYPGGDLSVVFLCRDSYPSACGVARVAPDGRPRWYRKDYSHHWPRVVEEDLVLVPSRVRTSHRGSTTLDPGVTVETPCGNDQVNIINGHGDLVEEISIIDAIVASRHAGILVGVDECDPLHINYADILGEDVGDAAGIAPGDLVVSLRNLSAFAILDKHNRRLKRLVRGSFHWQHGVRHLDKSRFMVYDNLGTDGTWGPSRLLVVDLATGEENTLFPNDTTPAHLRDLFTDTGGDFDVSANGSRVLLVDPWNARAVEIRLSNGSVLNVFRQLHDPQGFAGFPQRLARTPWLFKFRGIYYANRWEARR